MTVRYGDKLRVLLFRWRASVWRVVWRDLLFFSLVYACLSLMYRFGFDSARRKNFEDLVNHVDMIAKGYLPIQSMLLGFYVSSMVQRWWNQFELIPWPEEIIGNINLAFGGTDERSTLVRRSIVRYLNLTFALASRKLSPPVRKRFDTDESLVQAGLMTLEEMELYRLTPPDVRWFLPMKWIQRIVNRESKRCEVAAPMITGIQSELNSFLVKFRKLFCYEWVNIPLVYTQVVAVSVYSYFAACTIGHQFISPDTHEHAVDYYVPIFTVLQLIFFIGWFRVGLNLMKPFGDDDEDFELLNLLERNILVSYELVDFSDVKAPEMKNYVPFKGSITGMDEDYERLRPPLYNEPLNLGLVETKNRFKIFKSQQQRNNV